MKDEETKKNMKTKSGRSTGEAAKAKNKQKQQELQASQYARSLIEASLDPFITISPNGKITDVNEATIKITGVSRESLIGTDFSDYFTEPARAREGYQKVFQKGFVTDYPLTIKHKNGNMVDVLYNASVYKDTEGNVLGVFAVARDITESKRVLLEFTETKNFLDNILASSTKYSIIGKDLQRRILSWNEGARLNYGYTAEEIIGRDSNILHTPEDVLTGVVAKLLQTARKKGMAEGEFARVRKDGTRFVASVVVTRRLDSSGNHVGYLLMSSDISDAKQAALQIQQSSQYARSLIEASLDPLVTIRSDGKVMDVNKATEEVTGIPRQQLIGTDFSDYFTEPQIARAGYEKAFKEGIVRDYPLSIRHAQGRITDVLYNATTYRNEQGEVQGVFAAAHDISERKKADRELMEASLYSRNLLEASLDPLVTISADGKIMDVNKATEEFTGTTRQKLIGTDFSDYFTEPQRARAGYEMVFQKGVVRDYPLAILHTSGSITDVLYNATTYHNAQGEVQGVFAAARDVSELRKTQEALQRSHDELERRVEERTAELRESEERLTHALESGELGTWEMDTRTEEIWCSQRYEQIFGYRKMQNQWTYQMLIDHILPEDRETVERKFREAMDAGSEWSFECRINRADNALRWIWVQGKPKYNDRREVVKMAGLVRDITDTAARDWIKTGIARIDETMHGNPDIKTMSNHVLIEVASYAGAQVGAFYLLDEPSNTLSLASSYAYIRPENFAEKFHPGEGLIGQAALNKKEFHIHDIPDDYIKVTSSLGETKPRSLFIIPLIHEEQVKGVLEIGSLRILADHQLEYLRQAVRIAAINVEAAKNREYLGKTLAESQLLAKKLKQQQDELQATNKELEEQTQLLTRSEENLKDQQHELQAANEELQSINTLLENEKHEAEQANRELNLLRINLEDKAKQLTIASQYKSEFLANMSHELRTPLNSLLLLSKYMAANREGNLTAEQVESANIIYKSGTDLLSLIDDILDLSKIEAGRMELLPDEIIVKNLAEGLRTGFEHLAHESGLNLRITIDEGCPAVIFSDRKRIEQILKNLMSNALKFTPKGDINIKFARPAAEVKFSGGSLSPQNTLAISVKDTGIGIPQDKQLLIFEAFQQAEKGTARKYGGTGLGLSISRELARLLGGEIHLESQPDHGSIFTLYVPLTIETSSSPAKVQVISSSKELPLVSRQDLPVHSIIDDRDNIDKENAVILIIEDDAQFARLLQRQCHEKDYQCLITATGEEGIELACKYRPQGIVLDLMLPGIDGWAVLETLKETPETRHIPVHIMSVEEESIRAYRKGAIGFLTKPVNKEQLDFAFANLEATFSKKVKDLLVVEDDANLRKSIVKLIGNSDVRTEETATGADTLKLMQTKKFDCMILDIGLPDISGFELLEKLEAADNVVIPPIIVYTGRDLTHEEEAHLSSYSESIIIKGVRSEERLLDEVSLFLHRVVGKMPEPKRRLIADLHDTDAMFKEKTILIVDDDMRNAFALSRVLGEKGMNLLKAENGQKALDLLAKNQDVSLVLMDIMMPVMDGYEAIKKIRADKNFQKLPIIALTAKAMKEDRELCIAAGANDYLPKPVDVNRLLAVMRIWLYR
ncbi:MAG: PAS domain S-box protein [Smithella sp.]